MVKKRNTNRRRKGVGNSDSDTRSEYFQLKHFLQIAQNSDVKKAQLQKECQRYGLGRKGNKSDLIFQFQKLQEHLSNLKRKLNENEDLTNSVGDHTASISSPKYHYNQIKYKEALKNERDRIVLWRKPLLTLSFFFNEILANSNTYKKKLLPYWNSVFCGSLLLFSWFILVQISGPHQPIFQWFQGQIIWCSYWAGLGVLSSVGLGSGLHTFLLYLGPHIARVTLAAYECGGLNFPEPPYPDRIICPYEIHSEYKPTVWNIILKIKLEAIMWGAGTALGELPPYFMARAARLSDFDVDDDCEMDELLRLNKCINDPHALSQLSLVDRSKLMIERFVHRVGFFGILACASIPNPLFDLAGITCGHFLVPFWTFFGATLIGKAVIKISIQVMVVIIAFNESLIRKIMNFLVGIPFVGETLQGLISDILIKEKSRLHQPFEQLLASEGNLLSRFFEILVVSMVGYFVISVINAMAQNYHRRLHKSSAKCL